MITENNIYVSSPDADVYVLCVFSYPENVTATIHRIIGITGL